MSSRSNDPSPDSPSEDEAEAIGKALHFEYVNGLLTPESPVKASAYDMWERLDRDQHRMWDEIDPDRRRSYTATASRLLTRLRAPDSVEPPWEVVVTKMDPARCLATIEDDKDRPQRCVRDLGHEYNHRAIMGDESWWWGPEDLRSVEPVGPPASNVEPLGYVVVDNITVPMENEPDFTWREVQRAGIYKRKRTEHILATHFHDHTDERGRQHVYTVESVGSL